MLMTKYIFLVHTGQDGYCHTVVTRLHDGVQKYFYQCGGSAEGVTKFMQSMTDELIEGYFPRVDKKGKMVGGVDNWAYLGANPDRAVAEQLARIDLCHFRLKAPPAHKMQQSNKSQATYHDPKIPSTIHRIRTWVGHQARRV